VREVDNRLEKVITRWKDSKVLQTVSIVMIKGLTSITRKTDSKQIKVVVPSNIRIIWEVLIEEISIELWVQDFQYLGIFNFSMLNAFSTWNLSVGYLGVSGGIKTCVL